MSFVIFFGPLCQGGMQAGKQGCLVGGEPLRGAGLPRYFG